MGFWVLLLGVCFILLWCFFYNSAFLLKYLTSGLKLPLPEINQTDSGFGRKASNRKKVRTEHVQHIQEVIHNLLCIFLCNRYIVQGKAHTKQGFSLLPFNKYSKNRSHVKIAPLIYSDKKTS